MARRKRSAKQRPDWERYAVEAAKVLGVPEEEMMRVAREIVMRIVVRKTAEKIGREEGSCSTGQAVRRKHGILSALIIDPRES